MARDKPMTGKSIAVARGKEMRRETQWKVHKKMRHKSAGVSTAHSALQHTEGQLDQTSRRYHSAGSSGDRRVVEEEHIEGHSEFEVRMNEVLQDNATITALKRQLQIQRDLLQAELNLLEETPTSFPCHAGAKVSSSSNRSTDEDDIRFTGLVGNCIYGKNEAARDKDVDALSKSLNENMTLRCDKKLLKLAKNSRCAENN
eukprot:Nk52_evm7s371 gene=Nk52_evmTU7s371